MNLLQTTRALCMVRSVTGETSADATLQICQQVLGPVQCQREAAPSPGAEDTLSFTRKGTGKVRLLLLGHYDTVPGRISIAEEGDRLRALGAWDMKGGVAVALHLLRDLSEELFHTAELRLFGDEEWRSRPPLIQGQWDAVLAFEGSSGAVVLSRWGAALGEIKILGNQLRATYPAEGKNTIIALGEILQWIENNNSDRVHFSPTQIQAESALNVIPGEIILRGIFRYSSLQRQEEFLQSWPEIFSGTSAAFTVQTIIPPLHATEASKALLAKMKLPEEEREGSGDIAWFEGKAPILLDGLGPLGGEDHSPDEWISISSLQESYELAEKIVRVIASDEATT